MFGYIVRRNIFFRAGLLLLSAAVLFVLALSGLFPTAALAYSGGDGTEGSPYQISTVADLEQLRTDAAGGATTGKYYRLMSDLDLSGVANWSPIGASSGNPFNGYFDGGSHVIRNLNINLPAGSNIGLFGYLGNYDNRNRKIVNLGLENVNVTGGQYTGGLVGISWGEIHNCHVAGSVSGGDDTGGLAGLNYKPIRNSYFTGSVSGGDAVGGLVGANSNLFSTAPRIIECYAAASVSGNDQVGGLAGGCSEGASIHTSYFTGSVSGSSYVGGLAGRMSAGSWVCEDSYAAGSVSGSSYVGALAGFTRNGTISRCYAKDNGRLLIGQEYSGTTVTDSGLKSEAEMKRQATFNPEPGVGWDFVSGWAIYEDSGYPYLRNVTDGLLFETDPAEGQMCVSADKTIVISFYEDIRAGTGIDGITLEKTEDGVPAAQVDFDHTIDGRTLSIDPVDNLESGSFRLTLPADSIENVNALGLAGGFSLTFRTDQVYSGGGSGTEADPYLIACVDDLKRISIAADAGLTGGKYYRLENDLDLDAEQNWQPLGTQSNPFEGTFDGQGHTVSNLKIGTSDSPNASLNYAGLFGYLQGGAIRNVDVDAAIYSSRNDAYIGGLVGRNNGGAIENCHMTGSVTGGDYAYVGGLIGDNSGTVGNCHATGNLTGGYVAHAGGLAGSNSGSIHNGYATGSVIVGDNAFAGGLAGKNSGAIEDSYATGDATAGSGGFTGAGGLIGNNEEGTIRKSHATGDATAGNNTGGDIYVGGLVGRASHLTIEDSYAEGNVSGGNEVYAGGLVGRNQDGSIITNCYARGDVTSGDNAWTGGLAGYISSTTSQITNSYATGDAAGGSGSYVGGLVGRRALGTVTYGYWNSDAAQTVNGAAQEPKKGVGSGTDASTAKTSGEMRNEAFASLLNEHRGTGAGWILVSGENDGYPFFGLTVTFDSDGGSAVPSVVTEYGALIEEPDPAPDKENYIFGGWYQEEELTTVWDFATDTVTADITLFAKWDPDSSAAEITAYSFAEQTGPAAIDSGAGAIAVEVSYGTDVTHLVATFTLFPGASATVNGVPQVSGTTPNDFTAPVVYAVTSQDGSATKNWTVTVTSANPPAPANPVVDDANNTFGWTNVPGFNSFTDYEYSLDSGSAWNNCTANPQPVGDNDYAAGTVQVRVRGDAAAGRPAGEALLSDAHFTGSQSRIVFASDLGGSGNYEIYVMDAFGGGQTRLTNNAAVDSQPVWSPDGGRIAFASERDGSLDIYVMDASGGGQTRLTDNAATDYQPVWSPDGSRIAFASNRDGNYEIYVMNADGSGQTRLTDHTAIDRDPAWLPDGGRIAFSSNRDGNYELYVMNVDGSGQARLLAHAGDDNRPAWSPDGDRIAFCSNNEIYVMNADCTGLTRLTNNGAVDDYPAWSSDGGRIAFHTNRDGNYEIYVMNADGSSPMRLTSNSVNDMYPDWRRTSVAPPGPDAAAPAVADGAISTSGLTDTGVTLSWNKATDNESAQEALQYLVYRSNSNNIDTVVNIETNGTAIGSYATDINTKEIAGLTGGATYYFNVIVKDEAGNKTAYTMKEVTTAPAAPGASIASTVPIGLTEAAANDGSLASGTVTITIANGTLADPFVKEDISAANLPAGLDYSVSRDSDTQLTVTITGKATNHANVNDVGNLTFTIAQAKVTGATGDLTTANISIDFNDPSGGGDPGGDSGSGGGGSSSDDSSSTQAAINQAVTNGQNQVNLSMSGGSLVLNSQSLSQLSNNNLSLNLQYSGLGLGINPGSLPTPPAGGSIQINAAPITDAGVLNTLYVMTPDGRGIGVGYSITFSQVVNGETNSLTELNGEITLTFQLNEEDLAGIDPASLVVCKMDESTGGMVELGGQYQPGQQSVTVSTGHLCKFIILGKVAKERIMGGDRYQTAVAVSQKGWEKSDNVIIACAETYADALTGVTLAGIKAAPILLTAGDGLNPDTLRELERLQAKNIYIIGGQGVVSKAAELKLKEKYHVERIEGGDRYQTAVTVGQKVKLEQDFDTVILATGLDFPDAMAIAPFAAREGTPILYTAKNSLNENTEQALKDWGVKKVILAGGNGSVAADVEEYLKTRLGIAVTRLSGTDRYLTSLAIAKYYGAKYDYKKAVIATGGSFADALAGAPWAAKGGSLSTEGASPATGHVYPVILSGRDEIKQELLDYIGGLQIDKVYILGGPGAISDGVKEKIH